MIFGAVDACRVSQSVRVAQSQRNVVLEGARCHVFSVCYRADGTFVLVSDVGALRGAHDLLNQWPATILLVRSIVVRSQVVRWLLV